MPQNQTLAVFLPDLVGAGAQRVMLNLAKGMAEKGHDIDLVLAKAHGPYMSDVPDTIRIVDCGAPRLIASIPPLARYLRKENPLAILSGPVNANIVAIWAKKFGLSSTRVVATEHNTLSVDIEHAPNWRHRQLPKLVNGFYRMADDIVAVSNGVADDLAAGTNVPRERVRTIYNPVITPDVKAKVQAPLDHPWFEAGQPPVILGVGRLTEQKNFSLLIRAFAQVRKSHQARLLILGEGEQRPALEALVDDLGVGDNVSLHGFADNPYAFMSRAALFTLSSSWEGLPTVLIEAIYCGAKVVSTDCPSGPQEILDGGKYGQLVPVGDENALAGAMAAALAGDVPSPPQESWTPFEMDTVVDQYLDVMLGK